MTYLILPSWRLVLYLAESKTVKTLPIRADEYSLHTHQGQQYLAASIQKTLTIFNSSKFAIAEKTSDFEPFSTVQFNKTLSGLSSSNFANFYASDKFGDIYSVTHKGEQKYLNSNLGIPTFLSNVTANNKSYVIVGDEDTRIKIYNQVRMHQIISFWFLTRRVPLQLIQPSKDLLVLLTKNQSQINLQMQEQIDQYDELYQVNVAQLDDAQFNGKLFYVSKEVQEKQECQYQALTYSFNRNLYLLKLFKDKIRIITFKLNNQNYQHSITKNISIAEGNWNYIYGKCDKEQLIIVYGTIHSFESGDLQPQDFKLNSLQTHLTCTLNSQQHMIILQL